MWEITCFIHDRQPHPVQAVVKQFRVQQRKRPADDRRGVVAVEIVDRRIIGTHFDLVVVKTVNVCRPHDWHHAYQPGPRQRRCDDDARSRTALRPRSRLKIRRWRCQTAADCAIGQSWHSQSKPGVDIVRILKAVRVSQLGNVTAHSQRNLEQRVATSDDIRFPIQRRRTGGRAGGGGGR